MNIYQSIEEWLKGLKQPFLSEAHMQGELVIFLREKHKVEAIMEFPFVDDRLELKNGHKKHSTKYLDIFLKDGNTRIGIELKYQTRVEEVEWCGQKIKLKDKGADDEMRAYSIADVSRLEYLKKKNLIDQGIFVLLSNSPSVWAGTSKDTFDKDMRFYDSNKKIRKISSIKYWHEKNIKYLPNEKLLSLNNEYTFAKNMIYKKNDNKNSREISLEYSLLNI